MSGPTVRGEEGALIQSINSKLEQITARAKTIQDIGEQSGRINQTIIPSITQIKVRITTLRESIIQIAEAKRQLQDILQGMDPKLDDIVRLLGDNIEAINVDDLQRELQALSSELEQLERAVETAGLPNAGAMPPGARPPRPQRPPSRPAPGGSGAGPEQTPELLTPEQIERGQGSGSEQGSGQGGGYVFSGKRGAKTRKSSGRKSSGRKSSGRKSTRRKSTRRKSTGGKSTRRK